MEFSLVQTFRKYKAAHALQTGKRALVEAAKAQDGGAILSLLKETPALLDAPLEFVPGQAARLTFFDFLLQSAAPQEDVADIVAAFPRLLTQRDDKGDTLALRYFRESDSVNALHTLMSVIPDKSVADGDGNTLLHLAAARGGRYAEIAAHMNPFIEARNKKEQTPMMLAAATGQAVTTLLQYNADIHAVDRDGCNAVMHAIRHSNLDSATLLMQEGARVDFSDPAVETQMRVASVETNLVFLKALENRRKAQAEEDKAAREQEAIHAHRENVAGITGMMKQGAGRIRAPKTASFTKK